MHARLFSRCAAPALFAALAVVSAPAIAQPTFGNPSPTAGSDTSQRANQSADQALYKPVEYVNASKKGPALVVIPGEIKSSNATFLQRFTANNIVVQVFERAVFQWQPRAAALAVLDSPEVVASWLELAPAEARAPQPPPP